MSADAKWLDLLKANGWQFGCLAAAAWIVVFTDQAEWLPVALDATFKQATMLAAFALTALWVASIASTASNWSQAPVAMIKDRVDRRAHARAFRDYIPYMTEEERAVVAQLLHENRKSFTGANDGGYAATLLARGFVRMILAPGGQYVREQDTPFAVPDHIWDVAVAHRDHFPHQPSPDGADAWRVHWMAR